MVKITVFPTTPHLLAINDETLFLTRAELALLQALIEAWPRSQTGAALAVAAGVPITNIHWHLHRLRQRLAESAPGITWAYPPTRGQYVLCRDVVEIEEGT